MLYGRAGRREFVINPRIRPERKKRESLRFALADVGARSFQVGLQDSIRSILFLRAQPLICFSRAMATRM